MPPAWQITPVLVITISILGAIGNFLSLIILSRRELRSPHIYNLVGLGLSDFLLLIIAGGRTLEKLTPALNWFFGNSAMFIPAWIVNSGTKYFTVGIAVDRFLAINYPMKYHTLMTERKAKFTAFGITAFCLILSIWAYIHHNYIEKKSYSIYLAVVLHFLPFLLIVIFNIYIYIGLKKYHTNRKNLTKQEKENESVTRMLFAVVALFGLCSLVEVVRRILIFSDESYAKTPHYEIILNHFTDILYVLNSAANFGIYYACGTKFREVFFKVFGCKNQMDGDGITGVSRTDATSASVNVIDEVKV